MTTKDEVFEIAQQMKELRDEQKEFKKNNKDVFEENKRLNKLMSELKKSLASKMKELGMTDIMQDGMEFEVKDSTKINYNLEKLQETLNSNENVDDAIRTFVQENSTEKTDIVMRKRKRTE